MSKLRFLHLSVLCLLAAGCSDRLAGTSTTAENTVTGTAMLPGGLPAAGAVVSARSAQVVLARNRVPQSLLIGLAYADSSGRFELKLPGAMPFYLEIRRVPKVPAAADSFPESWFHEFPDSSSKPRRLGELLLEKSILLQGRLRPLEKPWVTRAWVGIAGTDNFRSLDPAQPGVADTAGVAFTLSEAPFQAHRLAIYAEPEVSVDQLDEPLPTEGFEFPLLDAQGFRDVGVIPFKPR
ncbi:MAG: hypothetical protein JWO30_4588 [Fibrobacteres bacterium]|nr:hypothetical protein [Fibrobacterota bacterium]